MSHASPISREQFITSLKRLQDADLFICFNRGGFIRQLFSNCRLTKVDERQLTIAARLAGAGWLIQLDDCVFLNHLLTTKDGIVNTFQVKYGDETIIIADAAFF